MAIDLNFWGIIASFVSLILSVVFWWLASKQADQADATLTEIRDKMMTWQSDINKAAINLIQARPEVIAQAVSLEEAKSRSAFTDRIAGLVESLAREADAESTPHKLAVMKQLLDHERESILGSEQIKASIIAQQQGGGRPGGD